MNIQDEVLRILEEALSLKGRAKFFKPETRLLGAVPELDSMTVVSLLTALEEQLGVAVDEDEINASSLATVGSLVEYVRGKLES